MRSSSALALKSLVLLSALRAQSRGQTIRTPAAPATPRVNGPTVFGVRPGTPFDYKIPATGNGTLLYSVTDLPSGLSVDPSTGMITGTAPAAGNYAVTLTASNTLGASSKNFTIKVGSTIGLTPAMGWSSWNAWQTSVTAAKVETAADALVSSGLINYGWSYVNTDDAWQGNRGGTYNGIEGNSTFLAGGYTMQGMVNHIHADGLKAGIYSTPWIQSYGGYTGGSANNSQGTFHAVDDNSQFHLGSTSFATNDANQWAAWGFDYMKYDWNPGDPFSVPDSTFHSTDLAMQTALNNTGRDIVYSYSNNMPFDQISDQSTFLNSWRTGQDIDETWASVKLNGFGQDQWAPYSSPGHFNDPDMLEIGWVGNGSTPHPTALTPDEQYTHITLWCMLSAPLLLGNDLTKLDAFTLNLITNPEVIAVDQDALGLQATQKSSHSVSGGNTMVYSKPLEDGTTAVALFNTGSGSQTVTANWSDLGVSGWMLVRDLWREKDLGPYNTSYGMTVASHSAEMFKLTDLGTGATVTWKGAADATTWNGSATNFNNGSSNVAFAAGEAAVFDNTAPSGATMINIATNVSPIVVQVNSTTNNYTFQGSGAIGGSAVLAKDGTSTLTINNPNTYSGGTFIRAGAVIVGGAGALGTGAVVNLGALTFNRGGSLSVPGDVSGTGSITQSGSGMVTLSGALSYTGATSVSAGALVLGSSVVNSSSVSITGGTLALGESAGRSVVLKALSLSIATAGKLDLANNKLIVPGGTIGTWNGSNYTGITGLIKSGRNGGNWSGNGIITSEFDATCANFLTTLAVAGAGSVSKTNFGGVPVASTDVLVMYTYAGDANLDGSIDGDDYFRIDSGFTAHATGYLNGDFNYDGKIDADDYFLIDRNYVRQGVAFSGGQPVDLSAVPEPGLAGIMGLGLGGLLARRSRRI